MSKIIRTQKPSVLPVYAAALAYGPNGALRWPRG